MAGNLYLEPFKLNDGHKIPLIGCGTLKLRGDAVLEHMMDFALAAGHRLFDTAVVYCNEESIGRALAKLLPKHNLSREEVFIISKLPLNTSGNRVSIHHVIKKSLSNLKVKYIDLYLIHWPGQQGRPPTSNDNVIVRDRTWQALIEARHHGWVKSIGVSNYTCMHLSELLTQNHGVVPAVNQVEWHPYCHQADLRRMCDENGIFLQGYGPLGGSEGGELMQDPTVAKISRKVSRSPANVLLSWGLQQGVGVIPKSSNEEHLRENISFSFRLSNNDMNALNALPQKRFAWDPTVVA